MKREEEGRAFSRRAIFGGLLDRGQAQDQPKGTPAAPDQVVKLRSTACIAFRGTLCTTCYERCPEPGAIELDRGRPRIVEFACTGCGDCVPLCPAPSAALFLAPRKGR